ncbi:MAG: hypothetical protein COB09_19125 [Thalassobium sp.]|nr:MAG: hypothetical protein COB09_19125 [Thalassobium sp.]
MSEKFGRSYRIIIDPKDGQPEIVVTLPLTIRFSIRRDTLASLNNMSLDIYNLGDVNRDRIFQDRFTVRDRTVRIEGGYDSLSLMFDGFIFEANSSREGSDIITRIEAKSGSFDVSTSKIYTTIDAGQTIGDVVNFLIQQFPSLKVGAIGKYTDVLTRPVVFNGATFNELKKYGGNGVFVDNNRVYVLKDNEVIEGNIPALNIESGLLETPRRDDGFLTVTTLFEPRVTVGQIVALESEILPIYNSQYKVVGVNHQGVISDAVGGDCRSIFNLWVGNNTFEVIQESQ